MLELYCSKYSKKKYFFIPFFPRNLSPLSHYSVIFSLFLLSFSICSLLSSDPNTILLPTYITHHSGSVFPVGCNPAVLCLLFFFFFWRGWQRGSLWWLWFFFFFFCCDRCLKGLWVVVGSGVWFMVGSGVWVVVGLWLKWVGFGVWVRCCGWNGLGPVFGSWLDRWAGIGWWWVWNSKSVDRWVDWLGWSSVAPMVAPVMIFFNGFAPVDFKSVAWADGFLVPWLWLWLLMGWGADGLRCRGCGCWWVKVLMGFWCRGCGCWWVDRWLELIGGLGFWCRRGYGCWWLVCC